MTTLLQAAEDLAADCREFRRELFLLRLALAAKAEAFSRPLTTEG